MIRWQVVAFPLLLLSSALLVYFEQVSLLACSAGRLNGNRLDSVSSSIYELAKYESLGFFDNIDENTWLLHKDRAQREPIYLRPGTPNSGAADKPRWLLLNVDPMFTCPNLRRVGGRGDGPKWTCDPHRLVKEPDCLIYSIGSNGIYKFEDGMVSTLNKYSASLGNQTWLPNCEFHVFDPNPKFSRQGDPEKNNIHYHAWGLKSSYEPLNRGTFPESFEFLSFPEMQERLGHVNRRVDIFKIDCEGCELTSYKDWLHPSVDIRQVLVETHSLPAAPSQFFDRFFDMGFVPFSKEANTHPAARPVGALFEWGWIRLHPDFLNRKTSLVHGDSVGNSV